MVEGKEKESGFRRGPMLNRLLTPFVGFCGRRCIEESASGYQPSARPWESLAISARRSGLTLS